MTALSLITSTTSNNSFNFPENSTNNTLDCKELRIRRNQLSQIFDPVTLETIFNVSGVPYLVDNNINSFDRPESRSQIDARSL
ncbi:unnamed protein product, partial [Rotaria magnacalcarata]